MRVRRYEAEDMQEALSKVREELGSNALILSTRKVDRNKGIPGLFGKPGIEVTAIAENNPKANYKMKNMEGAINTKLSAIPSSNTYKSKSKGVKNFPLVDDDPRQTEKVIIGSKEVSNSSFCQDLQEIKKLLKEVITEEKIQKTIRLETQNDYFIELYQELRRQDVEEIIAIELTKLVKINHGRNNLFSDKNKLKQEFKRAIDDYVEFSGQIKLDKSQSKITALVGPTGVGKTTTIAKLAANYNLEHNNKVALITFDTYRIAAVEQLKIYTKILEIPLEVVNSELELKTALDRFKDKELILIDTVGHSPQDIKKMQELSSLLKNEMPIEVHLVLSATTNNKTLYNIALNYENMQIDRLIFTKLDEAVSFGAIINMYKWLKKPLSYFTTGQSVPDDIEIAQGERVSQLLLKNKSLFN